LKGDKTNAKPKKILMYCTGGVRCERASQYVKSVLLAEDEKSLAENVFQLYGGIQNYMDTLGEKGTLFRGKNFVYDNRIAVGSEVVGSCVVCAGSFDDYSYQTRCTKCRMLLLGNVTHSFTHTRIYSLTHSFTYSFTHSLTHSLIHSLTYLLTYSLTYLLTYSFTYLLTCSRSMCAVPATRGPAVIGV
jgi:predicted sulfurtransferase